MSDKVICSANTSYKKQNGVLTLSKDKSLTWAPNVASVETIYIRGTQITSLFASKEGSAKIILRVGVLLNDSEQNLNFTFISASSAMSDRERFKTGLSEVITYYKTQQQPSNPPTPANEASPKASTSAMTLDAADDSARSDNFALTYNVGLRIRLLRQDPELKALHEALVLTGQITEEEFWQSREHLLQAELQSTAQRQGRAQTMVDARPELSNEGEVKVVVTPQLIADIFAQHPIVQKAYNDHVPPLKQTEFWQRFFSSKLYNKIRASSRQAGDTIKDDKVFDQYLDMEEEETDPDNLESDHIYRLLDLAATQEDHGETGNEKDFTMRYGHEKATLPLIRRFNHHSERILDQVLGKVPASIQISAGDAYGRNYENDIILEDLQGSAASDRILLNMQDQERYFAAGDSEAVGDQALYIEEAISAMRDDINGWQLELGDFKIGRKATKAATMDLLSSLQDRAEAKAASKANTIPDAILKQMVSLQSTSNEFLRNFWTSILPAKEGDVSFAARATPAQKAAKAQKMISYLRKTTERLDQIVGDALNVVGFDSSRVRAALQPTLDAVDHALSFYDARLS